jgi:hypothetical protein
MTLRPRVSLIVAAVLMIGLGAVCGAIGSALRAGTGQMVENVGDPELAARVGLVYLALGVVEVLAGVGIVLGLRPFWIVGVLATGAYALVTMLSGYFLFGSQGVAGTLGNAALAGLTMLLLQRGKRALRRGAAKRA